MEQDENLYVYEMKGVQYRFEAHSNSEAEKVKPYALLHFQDKLGTEYLSSALVGPLRLELRGAEPPHFELPRFKLSAVKGLQNG